MEQPNQYRVIYQWKFLSIANETLNYDKMLVIYT